MCSTFAVESEGSHSVSKESECEPSPSAKSIPIAVESLHDTGPASLSTPISPSLTGASSPEQLTLFAEAIPVNATATHGDMGQERRRQRIISCGLLLTVALALFSGRIQPSSAKMPRGRGGESGTPSKTLVTLCCPSASGRVALALTTGETACSCSPHYRTPTARDWKGMSAKSWRERTKGDKTPTLPDQIGGTPHPEFVEEVMGFPIGWSV